MMNNVNYESDGDQEYQLILQDSELIDPKLKELIGNTETNESAHV